MLPRSLPALALPALALLAACGGSPPPTAHPRPAPTPCPTGDALDAAAIAAWRHGDGEVIATCAPLQVGGAPAWVIAGFLERPTDDDAGLGAWTAVVRPTGEVLALDGDDGLPPGAIDHTTGDAWTAADLDGDGDDELIHVEGYSHMGYSTTSLSVLRVTGAALVQVSDLIELDSDNTAAITEDDPDADRPHTCTGTWKLEPTARGQRLVIARTGDSDCPRDRLVLQLTPAGMTAAP